MCYCSKSFFTIKFTIPSVAISWYCYWCVVVLFLLLIIITANDNDINKADCLETENVDHVITSGGKHNYRIGQCDYQILIFLYIFYILYLYFVVVIYL